MGRGSVVCTLYVKYGVLGWLCVISGCVSSFGSSGGREEAVLDCELDLPFTWHLGFLAFRESTGKPSDERAVAMTKASRPDSYLR